MLHRTKELYYHKIDTPEIKINEPMNYYIKVYDFAIREQQNRIPAHLVVQSNQHVRYHKPRSCNYYNVSHDVASGSDITIFITSLLEFTK